MFTHQKYCNQCGFAITNTVSFCGNCGVRLSKLAKTARLVDVTENTKNITYNAPQIRISGKTEFIMLFVGILCIISGDAVLESLGFIAVILSIAILVVNHIGFSLLGVYVFFGLLSTFLLYGYAFIVKDTSRASEFANTYPTSLLVIYLLLLHGLALFGLFFKKAWVSRLHFLFLFEFVFFMILINYTDKESAGISKGISFLFLLPCWLYFYDARIAKKLDLLLSKILSIKFF